LKEKYEKDPLSLSQLCEAYENMNSFIEQQVKKGKFEGCFHDGHYYPDPRDAGKSLKEALASMKPIYGAWMQESDRRRTIMGYAALALNAPGLLLAVVPTMLVGTGLEKMQPSHGTSGNLGLTMLTGMGFAALGTLATTAALTTLAGPVGFLYGAAAVGSGIAWLNYLEPKPKELKSYNEFMKVSSLNDRLKYEIQRPLLPSSGPINMA
jgi:hypothetical protein